MGGHHSRRRHLSWLASGLASMTMAGPGLTASERTGMIHQLRIYEIFDRNKAAFHARFRDHAARIMRRHGFDIVAMWEAGPAGAPKFVYLLRWPDEATLDARWAGFMADEEWSRIKDETGAREGRLVGEIENLVLRPVDYSPAL